MYVRTIQHVLLCTHKVHISMLIYATKKLLLALFQTLSRFDFCWYVFLPPPLVLKYSTLVVAEPFVILPKKKCALDACMGGDDDLALVSLARSSRAYVSVTVRSAGREHTRTHGN
jgi:hypothetical protein